MKQRNFWNNAWAMDMLRNPKAHSVGLYGETILYNTLTDKGYTVCTTKPGEKRGDLRVVDPETGEVLTVEVKTSRKGTEGWRFTLWKKKSQNHRHSDIVVLLAVCKVGLPIAFVIPTNDVRDLHSIRIPSHPMDYSGKYARYRQQLRKLSLGVQS